MQSTHASYAIFSKIERAAHSFCVCVDSFVLSHACIRMLADRFMRTICVLLQELEEIDKPCTLTACAHAARQHIPQELHGILCVESS
jgi:hypothetical protein